MIVVLVFLGLVVVGLAALGTLVAIDWVEMRLRGRRQVQRIAAECRLAESRLDRLTGDAMRQMLDAARQAEQWRP